MRAERGRRGGAPAVVLADSERVRNVLYAHRAGARGYVPTTLEPEIAFGALSFILRGGTYFPPSALDAIPFPSEMPSPGGGLLKRKAPPANLGHPDGATPPDGQAGGARAGPVAEAGAQAEPAPVAEAMPNGVAIAAYALTDRQSVVLRYLRRGASNKEIARALDMSEATVKVHVRQLLRKLGAANRTQAALIASREGEEAGSAASPHPPVGAPPAPSPAADALCHLDDARAQAATALRRHEAVVGLAVRQPPPN